MGTRGWKTADFSHTARTAHGAAPMTPLTHQLALFCTGPNREAWRAILRSRMDDSAPPTPSAILPVLPVAIAAPPGKGSRSQAGGGVSSGRQDSRRVDLQDIHVDDAIVHLLQRDEHPFNGLVHVLRVEERLQQFQELLQPRVLGRGHQ